MITGWDFVGPLITLAGSTSLASCLSTVQEAVAEHERLSGTGARALEGD
jgi:hypothetical protein